VPIFAPPCYGTENTSSTVNTVPLPLKGKAQDAPVVSSEIDGETVVRYRHPSDEVVPIFAPPCYGTENTSSTVNTVPLPLKGKAQDAPAVP